MKSISIVILVLANHLFGLAQSVTAADTSKKAAVVKSEKQHKPLSMTLSFFDHSISVPFHKIISEPLHPGVQAGVEGRYFETDKSKIFQTFNMGMFYNNYNGTGFYLNTELAYRYTSKYGIFAEILLGGGYLRTYHPVDIYQLNSSGTYERVSDKGFSSPMISFALGIGYLIKSRSSFSFAPFIRYENIIQTTYSPDLEVLPQSALHIGVRLNIKKAK